MLLCSNWQVIVSNIDCTANQNNCELGTEYTVTQEAGSMIRQYVRYQEVNSVVDQI